MTDLTRLQQKFLENLPEEILKFNEPMSSHTSFRIGGRVEVMVFPRNGQERRAALKVSAILDTKPAILGAGTNVLAPDNGISGVVICLKDALLGKDRLDETTIQVMAGETMTKAAIFAANLGLSGLEFAHGIPGTIGGGIYMNAGAYGGEICQVCQRVEIIDRQGNTRWLSAEEMCFSYRHSVLENTDWIVLRCEFRLTPKDPDEIRAYMKELMAKRSASQPLDLPSAGSAFKRPIEGYAAALIDGAGLKGFRVGGAAISTKHAGFAVNMGNATAEDVKRLLQQVSDIVYDKSGIRLEPEVRIW